MNKNEFEKTLSDVRKAYRLIYLYQRRVLDLVSFIGNKLSLNLHSGWSKFSKAASTNTRVNLSKWSWDWLTLYFYEFHFGVVKDDLRFSIFLQSDSGFFESDSDVKTDISKFIDADDSSTRLIFVCGNNVWGCPYRDFLRDGIKNNKYEFEKRINNDKIWIAKAYDLDEFLNEKSTIRIINDFIKYAENYKINLVKDKNEVQQFI